MTAPFRPAPNGQQGFPGQQQQPQIPQQYQQQPPPQQPQMPQVPFTQNILPEPALHMPAPQFPQPQQQPPGPQFQPAWQGGQQIPQQPQYQGQYPGQPGAPQYQGQPPQPQQRAPQAPAAQVQFDQQGRMFGPGVPQELQGRTMQEALQTYGMMRQAALQRQQSQQPAQQPQQPQVPAQRPATSFFTDPEGAIERVVQRVVTPMIQPVLEQTTEQAIQSARQQVAQQYPQHFAQLEGEIVQRLQGLPAQTLANPEAWRLALEQAVGAQNLRGQPIAPLPGVQQGGQWQPANAAQQQTQNGQVRMPWHTQPQQAPSNLPFTPAAPAFFTESPMATANQAPNGQTGQGGDPNIALTPQQLEVARRFGMTPQQYVQGMGAGY